LLVRSLHLLPAFAIAKLLRCHVRAIGDSGGMLKAMGGARRDRYNVEYVVRKFRPILLYGVDIQKVSAHSLLCLIAVPGRVQDTFKSEALAQ
jgi:hypothetical protein